MRFNAKYEYMDRAGERTMRRLSPSIEERSGWPEKRLLTRFPSIFSSLVFVSFNFFYFMIMACIRLLFLLLFLLFPLVGPHLDFEFVNEPSVSNG